MLIGYARVSTTDQNLDLQLDALKAAGCEKIFTDTASGGKAERPGLASALELCRKKDTLVVWKLDRLGRSLPHLVETVRDLEGKGIGFKSLQESIDTTTSGGKLIFHIFASLAEFERDIIKERTNAGLAAARARGRTGGRPKGIMDTNKQKAALALKNDTTRSVAEICKILGVCRNTYYKYIRTEEEVAQKTEARTGKSVTEHKDVASQAKPEPPPIPEKKTMRIELHLRVEGNNKYIRTKNRVRGLIEDLIFEKYRMEKPDPKGYDYILTIPYETDEGLDETIGDIFTEISDIADYRNCFTEVDAHEEGNYERAW